MVKPALKILLIITLFANGILVSAKISKSSLNNLQESLEQLVIIKSSSKLPLGERAIVEVEARKTAFNRVLDLAVEELNDLRKKLEKLTHPDRLVHLNKVTEYQNYFEIIRGQINKEINFEELVDIAKNFKKWRETIYNKEVVKIINFILVFQNQEAIRVAENRLERIVRDFKIIKSYLMPNEWSLADKLVNDAKNLIAEAKEINLQNQTNFDEAGIQATIKKIATAYKNFIALSELVR